MRRRRGNSRGDILIDLTSLLDVIFIILLVVLCGQRYEGQELTNGQAAAEKAQAKAKAEYQLYADQLELADSLNQLVCAVSVIVPYQEDVTKRTIMILKEGEVIEEIPLRGHETKDAFAEFRASLVDYIQENKEHPVILSLNEDDEYILYRDEMAVSEIFADLAGEHANVYIKGSISEEAE